ncbi:MAG: sugar-binding transcriptional regulator [Brachybacterium sp.]
MSKRDRRMLVEAARLYYDDGMDQNAIGEKLGLSKSGVSRVLRAAKDEGIVQIHVIDDEEVLRAAALEEKLVAVYGLRGARVARTQGSMADPLDAVARLGAEIFHELAPSASRIGFGWGVTMQRMIDAVPPRRLAPGTTLTSLVGGMPTVDTGPSGNNMLVTLAERCAVRTERFDAPAIVESAATFEALTSESSVHTALDRARAVDVAFVGIGSFGRGTSRQIMEAMQLDAEEEALFLSQGPVGDLCGHYFDAVGHPLGEPSSRRVIGLPLEDVRRLPLVVGVAAGAERRPGVHAALCSGTLDVLVVDEALALGLVEKAGESAATTPHDPSSVQCPQCGYRVPMGEGLA